MSKYKSQKEAIENRFSGMSDFDTRSITSGGCEYFICFITTFSSRDMINRFIIAPLLSFGGERRLEDIICDTSVKRLRNISEASDMILAGNAVVFSEADDCILAVMTKSEDGRSISEPETENVIRGAHEGFTENAGVNAMLLRRRIRSTHLKKEDFTVGELSRTMISIMYLDNMVRPEVLSEIRKRISKIKINGIIDSGYVEAYIQDGRFEVYPTVGNTERPDKTAAKILEGRIAVIVDGSPVVLTVPYLFAEGFQITEDYSKSVFFASFERTLRFAGTVLSLFLPALFLAAVSAPDLVLSEITSYIHSSREGMNISVLIEMTCVFLLFEFVREVSLRMPKAVGSAVGIVGSLILGDSAVDAGIISSPVLIVVAFSAVCNFLAPPYMNANVIYRAFLLLASGLFGVTGLVCSVSLSLMAFCAKESFGTPYLSPIAPLSKGGWRDFLVMLPVWKQKMAPASITGKKIKRAEERKNDR